MWPMPHFWFSNKVKLTKAILWCIKGGYKFTKIKFSNKFVKWFPYLLANSRVSLSLGGRPKLRFQLERNWEPRIKSIQISSKMKRWTSNFIESGMDFSKFLKENVSLSSSLFAWREAPSSRRLSSFIELQLEWRRNANCSLHYESQSQIASAAVS